MNNFTNTSNGEQQSRDLAALNQIITAIGASLELPEILANLKVQLAEQMGIPGGAIFFYIENEELLNLEAAWGIPSAVLTDYKSFPASIQPYRHVIENHKVFLVEDFRDAAPYSRAGLSVSRPDWQGYVCFPLLSKGEVQGVVDLFSKTTATTHPRKSALYMTLGQQLGAVIQNAHLFAEVRAGRQRLQMLSQQLLEVQEAERRHISRELHDEVGQALTAVKVNLQAVLRNSGSTLVHPYIIEESIGIIERVLLQVRNLSIELRPSLLDDLGVVAALRWYIDRQGQRAGFKTEFLASPSNLRLQPDMETVCFRVVQEALTNVVRHAIASHVRVELIQHPEQLELVIRDDGIGFDVETIRERAAGDTSLGLLGMQQRVKLVNGTLKIRSDPRFGTEVRAIFPTAGREQIS